MKVREFEVDSVDKVRGCYNSHLKIYKEISKSIKYKNNKNYKALILEDNLELTNQNQNYKILNNISLFFQNYDLIKQNNKQNNEISESWDIFHLAYMMYVPGLNLQKLSQEVTTASWRKSIVQMISYGKASVGTSSYIISSKAINTIIQNDKTKGYYEAIPNIMGELFPLSRFACYPMIFHRSSVINSIVNPPLDSFRKIMFNPIMYTNWEKLVSFILYFSFHFIDFLRFYFNFFLF